MNEAKSALDGLRIEREASLDPAPRRRRLFLLALVLCLLAAAGWWFANRPIAVRTVPARPAESGGPRVALNASGYVTARREATVSSKVTGKVTDVLVEEGMKVDEGQELARLDDTNVKVAVALSEAQVRATHAALSETEVRLDEAARELRRVQALVATRIATEADLDRAQAEVRSLEARLERQRSEVGVAERELAVRKQDLDDLIIRAPFAGIVTVKTAQPGEMISPISAGGGFTRTGICTLVDMASREVEVDVNESYINRVSVGQTVEIALDAYPDWKIPGKVIAIIPTADRQKSTVKVRVAFDQLAPRILPDMAVRVAFRGEGPVAPGDAGVLAPKAAIASENGRDFVWTVKDGRAVRRNVTRGATQGEEVTLTGGLQAGDAVVVEGGGRLREGARVRISQP
jgi:RND family efflux transporter MFP subunit